jgi:hypothetical protein
LFIRNRAAGRFEGQLDLAVVVGFVEDQELEEKNGVVIVEVEIAAGFHSAFYGVPDSLRAFVQHFRDTAGVWFRYPFVLGHGAGEFGGFLKDGHHSLVMEMGEHLAHRRALRYGSCLQSAVWKGLEQVEEDGVVAAPRVQQRVEQRSILENPA